MGRGGHLWASEGKCLDCYLTVRSQTPNRKGATQVTTVLCSIQERCGSILSDEIPVLGISMWCSGATISMKQALRHRRGKFVHIPLFSLVRACLLPEIFYTWGLIEGIFRHITQNLFGSYEIIRVRICIETMGLSLFFLPSLSNIGRANIQGGNTRDSTISRCKWEHILKVT